MMATALLDQLAWPEVSVCGWAECPTTTHGYCIECHTAAWNALVEVRRQLVDGMVNLAGMGQVTEEEQHFADPSLCDYCTPQPGDTPESLAHSPERCKKVTAISYRADGSIRRIEFDRG